jgi:hypothetical protein
MHDGGALGVWLFLTVVSSVTIVAVFWYVRSRDQMRHELVLKLLESGQPFDSATLDKVLSKPTGPAPVNRPPDPRDGYRNGGFVFFLMGFCTLALAVTRSAGVSYPLIALGLLALALAFRVWWLGDRDFRAGTLPTLKYQRDPREAHQSGGFVFFLIGYGTVFAGIVRGAGVSFPLIGLGLLAVVMALLVWVVGDKEYREGRLAGGVLRAPDRE